jgi:hypothetical protein
LTTGGRATSASTRPQFSRRVSWCFLLLAWLNLHAPQHYGTDRVRLSNILEFLCSRYPDRRVKLSSAAVYPAAIVITGSA